MKRVMKYVSISSNSGCWNWEGCKLPNGYGKLGRKGKTLLAHRYVYQQMVGEIPDGLLVMHSCDNPSCVNPEHLSVGTYKENNDDCKTKGRNYTGPKPWVSKGAAAYNAKLTFEKAKYIRHLYFAERRTLCELGKYFNVAFQTISKVINNGRWIEA